jgi:nitroreductase
MDLLTQLNWRYATKQFDPTRKIPAHELDELLEALHLAPSSFGLQPWAFILVEDQKLRARVREHAWNQPQVTDASHFVVLCTPTTLTAKDVEKYVQSIAKARGVEPSTLDGYKQMMLGFLEGKSEEQLRSWMARQLYIALGTLLTAAAIKGIDACPMEGFDPAGVSEALSLGKKKLIPVAFCALGYRSKDDPYAQFAKVRYPKKDVVIKM